MRRVRPVALVGALALAAGCGVPSEPSKQADEVASVAAEAALLAEDAAAGDSTGPFVETHAEALRERLAALRPKIVDPALEPVARDVAEALRLLAAGGANRELAARLDRDAGRADELAR